MGSCAAPSAKGDDKFITTDYLQQCHLRSKNEEAPKEGDMKKLLTQGKVVLASMVGDLSILRAMQSNEEDTNQAYKRMSERKDMERPIQKIILQGLEDEKRHFHWIQSVLAAK